MQTIRVIDSHTAGEPTRVVLDGGPDLGAGPLSQRLAVFRERFDRYRRAIVREPRGGDVLVGALVCEPHESDCALGVIFFNNVGYLGMCGHGLIGLVATLAHEGRIGLGVCRVDTPVGVVTATLLSDGAVSVINVPSFRRSAGVLIDVPGVGPIAGDVAWGGNWFFLVDAPVHRQTLESANVERLVDFAWRVRQAVNAQGFPEVDHVELFGPAREPGVDVRNFVLCPGKAFDRSPCGTGTCAKLACLAADGTLAPGVVWTQESIIGSSFTGGYRWLDQHAGTIEPTITGRAFVTAEATLRIDEQDPFGWGIG